MKPRILDLYCGAGLVAEGLIKAGVEPWGVDLHPQRSYPGPFIQHDALTRDDRLLSMFDAFWASPPCLRDTLMRHAPGAKGLAHPDLITPTRAMLQRLGKPYVIENVATAALLDPVVLCGSHFGLGVDVDGQRNHLRRHRKFETNWLLTQPPCAHKAPVIGVYGGHAGRRSPSAGGRGTADFVGHSHRQRMAAAMGTQRDLTIAEISQGVPPAYAAYVGRALLAHLQRARAAA